MQSTSCCRQRCLLCFTERLPARSPAAFSAGVFHQQSVLSDNTADLALVVQNVDNAIHQINHYPVDSIVCFANTYPLDSDLSSG